MGNLAVVFGFTAIVTAVLCGLIYALLLNHGRWLSFALSAVVVVTVLSRMQV